MEINKIYEGDALEVLKTWPAAFIQTMVTSPPYWGLRDYGIDNQLGLEKIPEEYIAKMMEIFRGIRRCLRDDGTVWLNLGDSYAGSWGDSGNRPERTGKPGHQRTRQTKYLTRSGHPQVNKPVTVSPPGLKPKDLCMIPARVALALQADGWYLRSDIIWNKPNPMPEPVADRPTKAHEYIFLLTKSQTYFYDAEAIKELSARPGEFGTFSGQKGKNWDIPKNDPNYRGETGSQWGNEVLTEANRNKRSVWKVATQPYSEAHFATFPEKLIEPCILAGTSEKGCCVKCGAPIERVVERKAKNHISREDRQTATGGAITGGVGKNFPDVELKTIGWRPSCKCKAGTKPCIVLDPFMGSGTTALVALKFNRQFVGIELNPKYIRMAERRIAHEKAQIKMF